MATKTRPYVLNRCSKPHDQSSSCSPLPLPLPLPFLPDELIFEILLRLPVRSLVQFRCVCKSWKTLISDPQFAKDHLRTSIADPNMTHLQLVSSIIEDECKIESLSMKSLFQNPSTPAKPLISVIGHQFQIIGSCNGLLCLFDADQGYVRLWNPSTRCSSKGLPIANAICMDSSVTFHGFGYDHVNDKYKMLVVVEDFNNSLTKIFTFGANSWTRIQKFPYIPCSLLGKFVRGSLNWIAKGRDYQWVIISLDLGKENFGELLLPEGEGVKILFPVLDASRDSLCFCYFDWKTGQWVLWMMKEYGVHESWTKLTSMMIPRVFEWGWSFVSSCILENGFILFKDPSSALVLYNLNHDRLLSTGTKINDGLDFHIYHQTLVSPLY